MARPVLEVRDLWVQQEGELVCRGVRLRVEPGEVVALVGPPGAGKSSLLDCMALELAPCAGSVLLHGVDITGADADRRAALRARVIGMVRAGTAVAGGPGPRSTAVATGRARTAVHLALGAALGGPFDVVLVDGAFDDDGTDAIGGDPGASGDGDVADHAAARDRRAARQVDLMYALHRRRGNRAPAVVMASRNLAAVAAVADTVTVLDHGAVVDTGPVAHVLGAGRWRDPVSLAGQRSA